MNSFVLILASNLEDIIESSFYLSYYANIQPSEIDKLTTYEFDRYMELLNKQVREDRDYEFTVARMTGIGSLLGAGKE